MKDWKHILARTKKSYDAVKEDAQKQGVSTTQLLALHMYRENYNTNRDLAILSYKIYKKEDLKKPKFVDPERALHLSERLKLGRGRYTDLKILMKNFVTLPTYAEVSLLRRAYSPKLKPFFNQDNQVVGICSDMKESLQCHIQRMIQSGDIGSWIDNVETSLLVKVTVGMDGRGKEKEYKQRCQVSISTTHSFSITYFISDIAEIPNAKNGCVDCYCDKKHRICSFQIDIEERKKTCDIAI